MNLYHNKNKKYKNKKEVASMIFQGASFYVLLILLIAGGLFVWNVYNSEKNVEIVTRGLNEVTKGDSVEIFFSTKMLKKSVEEGISIKPGLKIETRWKGEKKLVIVPIETPKPNAQYNIKITGAKTGWLVAQRDFEVSFLSPDFPGLVSVYPADGQDEVDYYEHITLNLDRPLTDDFKLEVLISPMTGFSHKLNETKTQLVIEPTEQLDKNTQYKVEVKVQHQEYKEESRELYQGRFVTKLPPVIVYSFDGNGDPAKTEERKEVISAHVTEGRSLEIDLSSQSLYIFQDGKEQGAYKVSTGLRGMDTPEGTFKVLAKSRRPWSAKYKLYMPWFIQFTYEGHGIHELPEWPSGYKEGANHLGIPVSHGCVRLGIGPAKKVYDFVQVGTPVVISR
ncbi:MAG: L,D-transpeptidase family protein [Patescibacteria group bacterium]|nr:L,D-transpeptidase family protein [Patescibacteria group bacterium]